MRLYYGGYGHHPSGKEYEYLGNDGYWIGQHVVAPVEKHGNTYSTMFTITRTGDVNLNMATNEITRLLDRAISLKKIQGTNTLSLPGGRFYNSKAEWTKESNKDYWGKVKERLGSRQNYSKEKERLRGNYYGK